MHLNHSLVLTAVRKLDAQISPFLFPFPSFWLYGLFAISSWFSLLPPQTLCNLFSVFWGRCWASIGLFCGKLQGSAPLFDIAHSLILLSSSNFKSHVVSVPHPPELCESQRALSFLDAHVAKSRFNHPKWLLDLLHSDLSHYLYTS